MKSFIEWIETSGFYVRAAWDIELDRMIGIGKLQLLPHQKEILDMALRINPITGYFDFETVVYSCIKKSGKTALAAAVGAWYVEEVGVPGTEVYCIANDLESAEGRVMRDIKFHFEQRIAHHDPFYNAKTGRDIRYTESNCKITQYNVTLPNESFVQALAQSYKSVAGSRHALTLWDELWGVTTELSRRVWDEMTPIPTIAGSLRFIATYAGFENESDLLWDIYIKGVDAEAHEGGQGERIKKFGDLPVYKNKRQFTYWDNEPRMPWQTDAYYDQQMEDLRPSAFLRLHKNMWVTSHESFLPVEWWDRAAKSYHAPATIWADHPFRGFPIYVGIDAGQKRDSTAIVGVGYNSKLGKVGQVFHKIWTPAPGDPIDLDATVEKELQELYTKFNIAGMWYDPTHLIQTMMRLKKKGLPVHEFPQTIPNMTGASQLLYELFKNKNFETYPDDVMRKHVQMAVAETTSRGFRIVKTKVSARHHIDGAIALAMAAYAAIQSGGADISIPLVVRSPYSDATQWPVDPEEMKFPFELRSN